MTVLEISVLVYFLIGISIFLTACLADHIDGNLRHVELVDIISSFFILLFIWPFCLAMYIYEKTR